MTAREAIIQTAGERADELFALVAEAEREDLYDEGAVIIPPLGQGDGTVIWFDDSYGTMIDVSLGAWHEMRMSSDTWIQYAIETIRAAGYDADYVPPNDAEAPAPVTIQDVASWRDLIEVELGSNPPEQAPVQLRLDPAERTARLETTHRLWGTPMDVFHGVILTWRALDGSTVDGPALVEELRGEEMQGVLGAICDHWTADWDGSNHVGALDEIGQEASDWLEDWLRSDAPALDGGLWRAEDWLVAGSVPELAAETTDAELSDLAEKIIDEATESYVILDSDDVDEALERRRQALIDEAAEDAE